MHIGLTSTTIEPALTQGKIDGIGVYTKTLYAELTKLHYQVTSYAFPKFPKSNFSDGILLPLPYTSATLISLAKPAAHLLYRNVKKPIDLLHVTDHMIPRMNTLPIVATIHDALMFTHPEWYPSKIRGLKNGLRKKTFQWVQHFITISHAMIPELVTYMGIPEKNISVVYNGISSWWHEEVSHEDKNTILQKLHLPEKFILFTGTLQPKKNLPRLVEAYLNLPIELRKEYPLVIVGKAGWDIEETSKAINKLTAENAGYWLNYVTDEEIRALYQAASLYIFPSLHEGFGRTLLEAFASKTPVITSTISALPEVAGDAAYLVDPYNVNSISRAMHDVLTQTSLQQELIAKGLKRVTEFTLEKCAQETLKIYQQI